MRSADSSALEEEEICSWCLLVDTCRTRRWLTVMSTSKADCPLWQRPSGSRCRQCHTISANKHNYPRPGEGVWSGSFSPTTGYSWDISSMLGQRHGRWPNIADMAKPMEHKMDGSEPEQTFLLGVEPHTAAPGGVVEYSVGPEIPRERKFGGRIEFWPIHCYLALISSWHCHIGPMTI